VDARARGEAAAEVLKRTQKTPKTEKDLRRVLEDKSVDAVVCAAPDHWHAPAALMAMQAGKAIYVEKPVSFNAREGEMLVEAAEKYRAVFQMGSQRRSSTVYQQVIKEIHGGLIGTPRFARCWYATQRGPIGKGNKVAAPEWLDWDLWQGRRRAARIRTMLCIIRGTGFITGAPASAATTPRTMWMSRAGR
jgi:predicted dehydrogenase